MNRNEGRVIDSAKTGLLQLMSFLTSDSSGIPSIFYVFFNMPAQVSRLYRIEFTLNEAKRSGGRAAKSFSRKSGEMKIIDYTEIEYSNKENLYRNK